MITIFKFLFLLVSISFIVYVVIDRVRYDYSNSDQKRVPIEISIYGSELIEAGYLKYADSSAILELEQGIKEHLYI